MDARTQAIEQLYRDRFSGYCDALAAVAGSREAPAPRFEEAFARALRQRRRLRREESLAPWEERSPFGSPMIHGPDGATSMSMSKGQRFSNP